MNEPQGRILVVDDHQTNRNIVAKLLRKEYLLEFAETGEECLRRVEEFQPQVVLLDVMMPGMNGYDVCRRIKLAAGAEFRQVIMVSGRGTVAERVMGYEHLADDYLLKPFDHAELLCKIRVQFRLFDQFQNRAGRSAPAAAASRIAGDPLLPAQTGTVG